MRARLAIGLALVLAAFGAPDAIAATVAREIGGGTIFYQADTGETNDLTVAVSSGGDYTFTDPGATFNMLPLDCSVAGDTLTCPAAGPTAAGATDLEIRLEDGDDSAVVPAGTPSLIFGGIGTDDLTGSEAADRLEGEVGDDTLRGGGGNDELNGEQLLAGTTGQNTIDGGGGNDLVNAGDGPDTVQGGAGSDTLFGMGGADVLDGGEDTDDVVGGDGADVMRGGAGDDRVGSDSFFIFGGPPDRGDDQLDGGPGNDVLRPGLGPSEGISDNDTLAGGTGTDSVLYDKRAAAVTVSLDAAPNDGGAGELDNVGADVERLVGSQAGDVLTGGPAGDTIDGFLGPDTIRGGGGADTLDGGVQDAASDDVSGGDGDDSVRGNAGDDALTGDAGADTVEGGGGDDRSSGGDGTDSVSGGAGTDVVSGGAGDDVVDGAATGVVGVDGADNLSGDAGNDSLEGGDGDDTLDGGRGVDDMSGELGSDTVSYEDVRGEVAVTLNDRADDGRPGERDNVRTDVENMNGGGAEDTFTGSRGANDLDGGAGEDFVDGRRGGDDLFGGSARDVVRSRDGRRDVVDCGASADFAIADPGDRVRRCERTDVGRGSPTAGSDVVVQPGRAEAEFGLPGTSRTVPLLDQIEVPVATRVDARKGSVRVTASSGIRRRARQSATFNGAVFQILQRRSRRPVTEISMKGGRFARCRARGARVRGQLGGRTIRRLRTRARGRFRVSGRHSAATVRGTVFTVEDRCDGTLTRVRRGVVLVRDFRLRRTITVRAGKSYLARGAG